MGIFAKRDILMNEELTFNYNVDRYGHDAQVCFCGESNCVGFIGGKTQTDIGAMDELYLDGQVYLSYFHRTTLTSRIFRSFGHH
jgi:histone-lysine N-methyltransferase SETD2